MAQKNAIQPTRDQDFPQWYQQVIKAADMAENSEVRGCMVIKPWGYGIWEQVQAVLDQMIKATGAENVYFPLFIPLSFLEKEADHIEGFAKECAVVTHHRLVQEGGKLVPNGELEEPLVVRPTSEMIIGDSFARWVESYRDLPLLINQWANVVRWELRPRIFLRTTEFLWQEGHTVHATEEEAEAKTVEMIEVYRRLYEDYLAIPVVLGEKSPGERFPGALRTYTLEAMMQDGKALQGCTSHNLGQNFSRAQGIKFNNEQEQQEYAWTTSWGLTTRTLGGMIMVHGDDDGLRVPPKVAHKQVVILPINPKNDPQIDQACQKLLKEIQRLGVRVYLDAKDKRGKNWEWIKKGIPIRIEIGPKDLEQGQVTLYRRDEEVKQRVSYPIDDIATHLPKILETIQQNYYQLAKARLQEGIVEGIDSLDALATYFKSQTSFVKVKWCQESGLEEQLKPLGLTVRCIPKEQSGTEGRCLFTGKPAREDIIIAKAY